jgi:hypothetical protein
MQKRYVSKWQRCMRGSREVLWLPLAVNTPRHLIEMDPAYGHSRLPARGIALLKAVRYSTNILLYANNRYMYLAV